VHPSATIDDNNKRVVRLMAFDAETSSPGWTVEDLSFWRSAGFEVAEVASGASFGRVNVIAGDNDSLLGEADPDWEARPVLSKSAQWPLTTSDDIE